jgi:hypothetical protein
MPQDGIKVIIFAAVENVTPLMTSMEYALQQLHYPDALLPKVDVCSGKGALQAYCNC